MGAIGTAAFFSAAAIAAAQDIDVSRGEADPILRGAAGALAGSWLDQGDVGPGDDRKDLVIGSPGWSSARGQISILLRGAGLTGTLDLATTSDITINGVAVGGRFGTVTATGHVFNNPAVSPNAQRDLIVAAPGPDAASAGHVFVFAGPVARGTHDTSGARFDIQGLGGDRFGAALATADLNGDGFREVIVGAPGANRVFVFNLAGRAPGVISRDSADMIIVADAELAGFGVGEILESGGDVTGDGAYDLAIGVPRAYDARGAVVLVRGHRPTESWIFPGQITALNAAAAVFRGVDPGDRAGQSLRFFDIVEADGGTRDLIVGTPGGDGPPGQTRTDAGEAYALWGGSLVPGCDVHVTRCTRELRTPDVVFYGAAAGVRAGEALTGGDINRDYPDDVVLMAPGNPNRMELLVVYGTRLRTTYGQVVDLAVSGKTDRRVIGRNISSLVVWEATGEGANDIIVGESSASSTQGLVYVALSPKLQLSSRSTSLTARQCAVASTVFEVRNPSLIPLDWEARPRSAWLRAVPGTASSAAAHPRPLRVIATAAGLAPGTYTGFVDVTSVSKHVAMFLRVTVNLTVDPPSPLGGNANTDFTGDGCADTVMFRQSSGTWIVPGRPNIQLGAVGDMPVAGDYDGNLVAEPAVYRRSNSTWYFQGSEVQFGSVGDVPVPADYNGDGRTDIAVYRPSTGEWLIRNQAPIGWGNPGELPVPADYDGDGRTDIAVYARSSATWKIRSQGTFQWGTPEDVPVPSDYNGDRRADIAVYRRSSGMWYVRGVGNVQWGLPNDVPAPMDLNRDGRSEIAVYRRATGTWYSYDAATGAGDSVAVGSAGDIPSGSLWAHFKAAADLNQDGRTDITVWRPGNGTWFSYHTGIGTASATAWGGAGDRPADADYDGDGQTDYAVWRPSSGNWYILTSSSRYTVPITIAWGSGAMGDVPMPADYDGDGKADVAVYRGTTGEWFIRRSSNATLLKVGWGAPSLSDVPVPADFDGDGRADIAVWRRADGTWHILPSSGRRENLFAGAWGIGDDVPVVADYDGDGRADVAVWRPSNGVWYVLASATNTLAGAQWGTGALGDVPVLGDFDGDGRTDFSIWRPGTGMWHVALSSNAFGSSLAIGWGAAAMNDTPLGSVHVP